MWRVACVSFFVIDGGVRTGPREHHNGRPHCPREPFTSTLSQRLSYVIVDQWPNIEADAYPRMPLLQACSAWPDCSLQLRRTPAQVHTFLWGTKIRQTARQQPRVMEEGLGTRRPWGEWWRPVWWLVWRGWLRQVWFPDGLQCDRVGLGPGGVSWCVPGRWRVGQHVGFHQVAAGLFLEGSRWKVWALWTGEHVSHAV